MAIQLNEEMEHYLDTVLDKADSTIKATKFYLHRHRGVPLTPDNIKALWDVHADVAGLLGDFTDGEAYGAVTSSVLYALRGFEADASELMLNNRRLLS